MMWLALECQSAMVLVYNSFFRGYWCCQVDRDEVLKDHWKVPDLPYLIATTWASYESLHNPTAPTRRAPLA